MVVQPYISIPSEPAALSAGAILSAVVQQILQDNSYTLAAQNLVLRLTLPLQLNIGDRITLKVRSVTPQEIVFDVPLPPQPEPASDRSEAGTLLEHLELPPTKENEQLVREFVRMNAPIDRDLLQAVKADTPPKAEAAAFLAAHGVEPTQAAVDQIARLSEPAPTPARVEQPILSPFVPADPVELIQSVPPEPPIRQLLAQSPRLQLLDRLIALVAETPPEPSSPASAQSPLPTAIGQRLAEAIRMIEVLFQRPPKEGEEAVEYLRPFLKLPAAALREVRARLEQLEIDHLAKIPALEEARQLRGTVFESFDRLMTHRLVNQLAALRDQGIGIYEMAVPVDGRMMTVPLRVVRREGGGRGASGPPATVTLDADFTKLGRVRASLDMAARALAVRFRVKDAAIRDHLQSHASELVESLRSLGLEPSVGAEVASVPQETALSAFAANSPYVPVDYRA